MHDNKILKVVRMGVIAVWITLLSMIFSLVLLLNPKWFYNKSNDHAVLIDSSTKWLIPDSTAIITLPNAELILYGKDLIQHTAKYLGPNGSIAQISNGMNCQNCHLKGGTQYYGNSYLAVKSNYPKLRARSGTIESIEKRINDCIERSLNGKPLSLESKEMKSMKAYIEWVGKDVPKDETPEGSHIQRLKFLDRSADPAKGEIVFKENCIRCHGENGQGQRSETGLEWKYPPLHGERSYNIGAGLYRVSLLAGFVKYNMPNDIVSYEKPLLTDEEAWDVAAYLNSLPRPAKDISMDWPDISKKPFDHPFGPYSDSFTEQEHKFGPFQKMQK